MTPDTRGASALSATGNHNLTCLLSGTCLFEARPWILHSIRHKGLLLFQINLLIGDTNSPIMPAISVPFPGCSPHCPSSINCISINTQQSAWILLPELLGIGTRVRLKPPLAQRRADGIPRSLQTSRWPFPQLDLPVLFWGPAYQSDPRIVNPTRGIP